MHKKHKFNNTLIAFVLSLIVTTIAALRPLSLGYDTKLYVEVLDSYWTNGTDKFPDLIFDAYTWIFTSILEHGNIETRLYLSIISVFQGYLFYKIIKIKSPVEGMFLTVGYAPLIFFDIIRQGVSMLLIGYYLAVERKNIFIIFAVMTHINAVVFLFKNNFYRENKKYIVFFFAIIPYLLFIMWSGLEARFFYYISSEKYLLKNLSVNEILNILSIYNVLVIIFIIYSLILGKFSRYESAILITFYLLSICYPIFFRIYFFYFFIISCSKSYLIFNKSLNGNLFNILYIIVLLNFSTKTTLF
jgi:hypothetical protein